MRVRDLTQLASSAYLGFKTDIKTQGLPELQANLMQLYDFALSIDEVCQYIYANVCRLNDFIIIQQSDATAKELTQAFSKEQLGF